VNTEQCELADENACNGIAEYYVGTGKNNWHLCAACAMTKRFNRFKKRPKKGIPTRCTRCLLPSTKYVGIADPDMPQYPYCNFHANVMKEFIVLLGFHKMRENFTDAELMKLCENNPSNRES